MRRAAGAALAVAALLLLALAVQAWQWPAAAAREDRLLSHRPPPEHAWRSTRDGALPLLLGARYDARFRHAAALFLRARPLDPATPKNAEQIVASVGAIAELRDLERSAPDPRRRAAVLNLQAITLAEEAVFETDGRARVQRAADLLRRAIRLDPRNDAAKSNLELLMTISRGPQSSGEAAGGFGGFGEASTARGGGRGY